MWTGHVSRVDYVCRHHAIQWGYEESCEFVKIFSVIMQWYDEEKWGKLEWWMRWADEWLKSLSWLQEIIEAHVTLLTSLMKNSSFFGQSDGWWNVEYFQKTGRCYIRGSRIVPSSQKLATFCHHPTMQIKWQVKNLNLKSKIGLQWTMQWIKDSNILIKQGEQLKETVEWWKYELN